MARASEGGVGRVGREPLCEGGAGPVRAECRWLGRGRS